jgi:hypothetical protein
MNNKHYINIQLKKISHNITNTLSSDKPLNYESLLNLVNETQTEILKLIDYN